MRFASKWENLSRDLQKNPGKKQYSGRIIKKIFSKGKILLLLVITAVVFYNIVLKSYPQNTGNEEKEEKTYESQK